MVSVLGKRDRPKDKDVPSKPPIMKAVSKADGSAHRVLLVEDNATNQLVSLKILQKLGYDADIASNGFEALEALQAKPYDVVLMDCQMPEMDGFEATGIIRGWRLSKGQEATQEAVFKDRVSHIPIIAMTANAMKGDRERFIEAGMNDYLPKPIDKAVLCSALDMAAVSVDTGKPKRADHPIDSEPLCFNHPEALNRLGHDEELLREISGQFLERGTALVDKLTSALESLSVRDLRTAAHTLKGTALTLGAEQLGAAARQIESAAREDTPHETLASLVQNAREALEQLLPALRHYLGEEGQPASDE